MRDPCVALCTRTKFIGYRFEGTCLDADDQTAGNFYQILQDSPDLNGITQILDTTNPGVLLLKDNLFVTGIPSQRRDKVGTPIRWSFHLRAEDASNWFEPLIEAFKSGTITSLGDNLDRISSLSNDDDKFSVPPVSEFIQILPAPSPLPGVNFRLWTAFDDPDKFGIKESVEQGRIPEGDIIVWSDGLDHVYKKKSRQKRPVGRMATILLLAVTVASFGLWILTNLWSNSEKDLREEQISYSNSSLKVRENGSNKQRGDQIPKRQERKEKNTQEEKAAPPDSGERKSNPLKPAKEMEIRDRELEEIQEEISRQPVSKERNLPRKPVGVESPAKPPASKPRHMTVEEAQEIMTPPGKLK